MCPFQFPDLTFLKFRSSESAAQCTVIVQELSLELPVQFSSQCWNIVIFANFVLGTKFSGELQVLFRFF